MNANHHPFLQAARQRVVILDGGMGTSVMSFNLPISDYDGHENCTDILVATRPDVILEIHRNFLLAGCDAVETDSFGTNKVVLAEFGLIERCYELNVKAAALARQACAELSTPDKPRWAVGSIGPGTKLASLRQIDFDRLYDSYAEQIRGLIDGGADVLLIETCQDVLQIKAALNACLDVRKSRGREDIPIMVQVTMEAFGTMLVGSDLPAALTAVEAYSEVDVVGLNCATGPDQMAEHVRYLGQNTTRLISVLPNAGLPQLVDGKQHYALTPDELARWHVKFITEDGVSIIGGCCGTTYDHLAAVANTCGRLTPKRRPLLDAATAGGPKQAVARASSLYQAVELRQDNSFLIIGERCNTNGSKKFRELVLGMDENPALLDEIVQTAQKQVAEGSHILDVCVDYVGRNGAPDMQRIISRVAAEVQVPLMLDSTQLDVLEAGLKLCAGKCIINSMNLEDGEEKLAKVCHLARRYGAAVVALTIDDDPIEAMGKTATRKLEIARRIYDLAVNKYGIAPSDIMWDCLTFPITTGNEADRKLGLETLDGIEAVMRDMPDCQSVLGLSNISFGLKPAGRQVLNSVYLDEARKRGLTAAIVHASGITPVAKIEPEAYAVALDLIYDRRGDAGTSEHARKLGSDYDPLLVMSELFSEDKTTQKKDDLAGLPIEERLKRRIIDGNKVGIDKDLATAMQEHGIKPLDIINDILLDGMKVVGDLFGAGKMQLPFVLKSAETMKAAVAVLEPHMERVEGQTKGKIVLATVKGDVHDIGKNLVDIILTNNGYTVYNIGIKQPLQAILDKWLETKADAIGMSGLLVKSTIIMKENLEELNTRQLTPPVLLGGAALTRGYVEKDLRETYQGPVFYCKDAFDGLSCMDKIATGEVTKSSPEAIAATAADDVERVAHAIDRSSKNNIERIAAALIADEDTTDEELEAAVASEAQDDGVVTAEYVERRSDISRDTTVPIPPFFGARVIEQLPLQSVLGYMNEVMLFQVQWQHKKARRSTAEFKKYIDSHVRPIYRRLIEQCGREKILTPKAIYGYWPCAAEGDDLVVFDPAEAFVERGNERPKVSDGGGVATLATSPVRLRERRELCRFRFPRQRKNPYWCLADFFRPADSEEIDVVAFQAVTVGQQASDIARDWFNQNRYEDYLYLHGLSVETAEAAAEFIHKQIRMELGIAEKDARRVQDLFRQGYQGSRYSFGYPACPHLEDQVPLLKLLGAERIGLEISDEYQLHPEQSTTALVCHHPQARYFNVR